MKANQEIVSTEEIELEGIKLYASICAVISVFMVIGHFLGLGLA